MGFCAASHLDLVVSKLEQVMKDEMVRKSKGFFGFSKVQCTCTCKLCMYILYRLSLAAVSVCTCTCTCTCNWFFLGLC